MGENRGRYSNFYVSSQSKGGAGNQDNEGKQAQNKVNPGNSETEGKPLEKKWNGGQRLSQNELQERSRKGLCFKCGEKWGREHVCSMKNYRLILMEVEEEEEEVFVEAEDGEFVLEGKVL